MSVTRQINANLHGIQDPIGIHILKSQGSIIFSVMAGTQLYTRASKENGSIPLGSYTVCTNVIRMYIIPLANIRYNFHVSFLTH